MSTTSVTQPASFSIFGTAGVNQTTVFQREALELAMASDVDVESMGLIRAVGDLSGSGSDTMTSVFLDGVGANAEMSPLDTETSQPIPSAYTLGIDAVTVGFYGYSNDMTMKGLMLAHPDRILTMDKAIELAPSLYRSTVAGLVADAGATISTAIGSAATALSVDDLLDLVAAIEQTPGANKRAGGMPKLDLHSVQLSQLKASMRSEPSMQAAYDAFVAAQGVSDDVTPNFMRLGFDLLKSDKIGTSGGAYQGFCVAAGGLALARASYASVLQALQALGVSAISGIADNSRGLLLFTNTSGVNGQVIGLTIMLCVGIAKTDPRRRFQRRLISLAA